MNEIPNDCIQPIHQDRPIGLAKESVVSWYQPPITVGGEMVPSEESHECRCVKISEIGNNRQYQIRLNTAGYPWNPWTDNIVYAQGRRIGDLIKFAKVSEETFKLYRKFLTTRNTAYLPQVNRNMMDGV